MISVNDTLAGTVPTLTICQLKCLKCQNLYLLFSMLVLLEKKFSGTSEIQLLSNRSEGTEGTMGHTIKSSGSFLYIHYTVISFTNKTFHCLRAK